MKTTVAIVNRPGGDFELTEVDLDGPRDDEVLVRVVASGLCHTDVTMKGFLPPEMFPNVFGHEGAGVVEEVGKDVVGIKPGDHVVMSFRSCRQCEKCNAGLYGYCDSTLLLNYMGMRMDGTQTYSKDGSGVFGSFFGQSSFSQHAIAYADNCVVVDPSLDLTRLAPFGCGFQTGAGTVLNVIKPGPADSLVVFGVGAVGLAALAAAQHAGTGTLVAVDPVAERRELAARYGAIGVEAGDGAVDQVKELTGGGARYAIDTTAIPDVVRQAQHALTARGMLLALGLGAQEYVVDALDLLQGGKIVTSSVEGDADPQQMLPELIAMAQAGTFEVDHLITTYPFADINQAVADSLAGKVVKPVLTW